MLYITKILEIPLIKISNFLFYETENKPSNNSSKVLQKLFTQHLKIKFKFML